MALPQYPRITIRLPRKEYVALKGVARREDRKKVSVIVLRAIRRELVSLGQLSDNSFAAYSR